MLGLVAHIPVTTKQGVNFIVAERRQPLYLKVSAFLDRDAQYRHLATEVTGTAASDRERLEAVLNWTAERIQPAPPDWPVVDDHILHIIIRGYGTADQRADVAATLATYADVPAFWHKVYAANGRDGVNFTFAQIDGRWIVLDVANGFRFATPAGQLASAADVEANHVVVPEGARHMVVGTTPYLQILARVRLPPIPDPLRAELQMPALRIWHQMKQTAGY
jgi:hypothetical protein